MANTYLFVQQDSKSNVAFHHVNFVSYSHIISTEIIYPKCFAFRNTLSGTPYEARS